VTALTALFQPAVLPLVGLAAIVTIALIMGWLAWLRPVVSADGLVSEYELRHSSRH
jgi:hypothetical protein